MKAKARILIIDDEKDMCNVISKFVKEEGYLSEAAHEGKRALGKIKKKNYDLIILDYKLPDISGLEVLGEIRQLKPSLPVIMISAYGDELIREETEELAAVVFLDKPFESSVLLTIISALLPGKELM